MASKDNETKSKSSVPRDLVAEQRNWEQRILNEYDSPHKWNETWGKIFEKEIPFEYDQKILYLEKQLEKFQNKDSIHPPKVNSNHIFYPTVASFCFISLTVLTTFCRFSMALDNLSLK